MFSNFKRIFLVLAFLMPVAVQCSNESRQSQESKASSLYKWYKHNRVFVGAALGALSFGAATYFATKDSNSYKNALPIASVGTLIGAAAARRNRLSGFMMGSLGGYVAVSSSNDPHASLVGLLIGSLVGDEVQKMDTLKGFAVGGLSTGVAATVINRGFSANVALYSLGGGMLGALVHDQHNMAQEADKSNAQKKSNKSSTQASNKSTGSSAYESALATAPWHIK